MFTLKLKKTRILFLYIDFEDLDIPPSVPSGSNTNVSGGFHVNAEDGCVTLSEVHFSELQKTIQHLTAQVSISYGFLRYTVKSVVIICCHVKGSKIIHLKVIHILKIVLSLMRKCNLFNSMLI